MINTLSKTLEVQGKTQNIKQSPSTKIGTKPDARSQRNELTEVTERWTGRSDQEARQKQRPDAEQQDRPDAGQQCPIEYRKVPERRNCDRTLPVACDRKLAVSDQLIVALTVETTERWTRRRTAASDRVQKGSRAAKLRPDVFGGM